MNAVRALLMEMASRPEGELELDAASLLIAQEEYPHLKHQHYTSMLDAIAREAWRRIRGETSPLAIVNIMGELLFDDLSFRGNVNEYYDPRNCFLNEVLERRLGIPISLSIVYLETARRLELPVVGIGMPGHFMVKFLTFPEGIIVDPFHRGIMRTRQECVELLQSLFGESIAFSESYLAPVSKKQMLIRLLRNLKAIYLRQRDLQRTLGVLDRLLLLDPQSLDDLRDRGLVYCKLQDAERALADIEAYISSAPESAKVDSLRAISRSLRLRQRKRVL